jgi:hypothetical protein
MTESPKNKRAEKEGFFKEGSLFNTLVLRVFLKLTVAISQLKLTNMIARVIRRPRLRVSFTESRNETTELPKKLR